MHGLFVYLVNRPWYNAETEHQSIIHAEMKCSFAFTNNELNLLGNKSSYLFN